MTSPIEIVREFIDAINRHDVAMITSLMTKSHRFVDAKGVELTGRERLHDAWQGYFSLFPDYQIEVEHIIDEGHHVAVFGVASGTSSAPHVKESNRSWNIPSAWLAVSQDSLVNDWRVYCDTERMMRSLQA